ncbi:hypothetical protein QTN47_25835 [Danxiaibacter flavus]|uniref:Redoxin domain-containing protein n=1 Tax=Danxiaibacter flavus TaxID=3049108 RepID=A0ABV3ZM37_9BACT|nr:hypothetical protein QNM32_25835 [Chitinophagaceae bacterium DXS]
MKAIFHSLLFVLLMLSTNCNSDRTNNIAQTLFVPSDVQVFNAKTTTTGSEYLKSVNVLPFRIYTLVNAYCSCCVDDIRKCNQLSLELKDYKSVAVVPVCYSHDNFELLKFLFESDTLKNIFIPLILDNTDAFRKKNAPLIDSKEKFTVLTNGDNKILAIGNPYDNEADKNKFLNLIKEATISKL